MEKTNSTLSWVIWGLAALFYFYEFVLRVSPSVMVPELMASFGITASSIGILSAFYLYAYAPMQIPVGLLLDRYGIKRILSIASIVCGLGALLFAMAPTLSLAWAGRSLIGIGSSFAFVSMVYISSHWFASRKRGFLIGIANSLAMLGASAGSGPLTSLIHSIGWRETIGCFGLFGLLLGIAIYLVLRKDRHTLEVEKETARVTTHFFHQLKEVASHKTTWINALVALFFYMTTTAFGGLWGLSFVQIAYGVSKEVAGYALSMVFIGWLVGGPLTGIFSDFLGKRKIAIRIGVLGTLLSLFPVIYFPSISIYSVYILLFLVGLFSSAELLNFSLAIELNQPSAKATAAAFTNCLISVGDAIVQPLVGFLLDFHWSGQTSQGIRLYSLHDYQVALSCLPITLIIAFLLLFFIRSDRLLNRPK